MESITRPHQMIIEEYKYKKTVSILTNAQKEAKL